MSIPSDWLQQPISATGYLDPSGNKAVGNVTLTMSQGVVFKGEVIPALVMVFDLDASGSFAGTAPVNDDTGLGPYTGWTYLVEENFLGGRTAYSIVVTIAGGAVDLATADQVIPAAEVSAFLKKTDVGVVVPSEAAFNASVSAGLAYTDQQTAAEVALRTAADTSLQTQITTLSNSQASGQVGKTTLALLNADLNHDPGTHGWVSNDPTPANNGDYIKLGAANTGSWQLSPSPYTAVAAQVSGIAANFDAAPTTNLCNPARTDPWFSTDAAQKWVVINPGGALSPQSSSGLPSFAVLRRVPLVAHQPTVLSIWNASTGWAINMSSVRLDLYNLDGTFNREITSGFTVNGGLTPTVGMLGIKSVEIADPPINCLLGWTNRNSADYTAANPLNDAGLAQLASAVMLNAGASAADFVPYAQPGAVVPDPVIFKLGAAKAIAVAIQNPYVFILTQKQGALTGLIQRVLFNQAPSTAGSLSGCLDFFGARECPIGTTAANIIGAWNKGSIISNGGDEVPPIKPNNEFIGANHGKVGYSGAMIAHGKTAADVGSIWRDGASKLWTAAFDPDANNYWFIPNNTGAADKWVMGSNPPTGLTLTHVSGAVHTAPFVATAWTQIQFKPMLRNIAVTLLADLAAISADGFYSCDDFRLTDSSEVLNPASQQVFLNGNVGSNDYTNPAIATQAIITQGIVFNRWGARTTFREDFAVQAWAVGAGAPGSYTAVQQQQRPSLDVDTPPGIYHKVRFYAPDQTATVGGVDYSQPPGADVANFTADGMFLASGYSNADPCGWYAMIGEDGAGNLSGGYIAGLSRLTSQGDPATRLASVVTYAYVSASKKLYIPTTDSKLGDMPAGRSVQSVGFKAFFSCTDPNFFIPGVLVTLSPTKTGCYAACVGAVAPAWLAIDKHLQGLPVTIAWQDHNNRATLLGGPNVVVGPKGVHLSTTGPCAFILLIG